jgi:cellulose synthase/poly-beta-1,6-N-acetylglucosamine synthase-like glycosyltransferase
VKSDCTAFPYPDALRKIVSNFADSHIGLACGIYVFPSKNEDSLEKEFRGIQYKIQQMEAYLHSTLVSHGGFGAYRKNLIPKIREALTSDDSEIVVNVVKQGYRAIIDPTVKIVERAPETFRDRRRQKDRRAGGVIRVILNNLGMFFNPRYGKFGFITLPIEFFILILSPILMFSELVLLICYSLIFQRVFLIFILIFILGALVFTKFSTKARAILDTYISCFFGLFKAFTKKKKWR